MFLYLFILPVAWFIQSFNLFQAFILIPIPVDCCLLTVDFYCYTCPILIPFSDNKYKYKYKYKFLFQTTNCTLTLTLNLFIIHVACCLLHKYLICCLLLCLNHYNNYNQFNPIKFNPIKFNHFWLLPVYCWLRTLPLIQYNTIQYNTIQKYLNIWIFEF